ncbi:MAG: PKD domain-containing protein [Lewinellaceae bacterium]|nr:PKD domain-containing protein [Lewinellaceae bacterium]
MKKALLLVFASLSLFFAHTQDSLSGIINHYAVVEAIDYCSNTLTVSDTSGFAPGQAILVIQMQGAEINTDNASSFGNITDLGSAGLYERAYIQDINGFDIILEKALRQEYGLAGAVQIVSMPEYGQAVVNGTLTAKAWDGSTGGVLAFTVGQLILEADIDVSGKGFRGGSAVLDYTGDCNFLSNYSNYAYDENSIRGAKKGEGISAAPASRNRGRGAQANGGGGGNDHNAGGGGGANVSGGGLGGENDNPSFFGCKGFNPGIGGKALQALPDRLFLGGGGGAGHGNNNVATNGGNGGGLVLIEWGSAISMGGAIRANGQSALTSNGDGGGGGGGGGTIAIVGTLADFPGILIEAKGGDGGNANNNNTAQCFGPGGGGAGGRFLISTGSMAFPVLSGGQSGLSVNSTDCGTGANGALAGANGSQETFDGIPEGVEANTPPTVQVLASSITACQGNDAQLQAQVSGFELSLQWQVDMGSGFENILPGPVYSHPDSSVLQINEVVGAMENYTYRLAVMSECFGTVYSSDITVNPIAAPSVGFTFTIDQLSVQFNNLSTNADAYYWVFGDGNSSNLFEPSHNYPGPGNYTATLTAINTACQDSVSQSITFTLEAAPVANFEAVPNTGCAPLMASFTNLSQGADNYFWIFSGGTPASSTSPNPQVTYNSPGAYTVLLLANNAAGSDTIVLENYIEVLPATQAAFSAATNNLTASFSNQSANATTYQWAFGDGWSSMVAEPAHTYAAGGTYTVQLIANGPCGADTTSLELAIGAPPVPDFSATTSSTGCAPLTVSFANESGGTYDSLLWAFPGGAPASSTAVDPTVVYASPGQYEVQLTLYSPLGDQTLSRPQAVTVYIRPEPDFDFEVNGLSVSFFNASSNAASYIWNFDDGQTSQEVNPVHTYSAPGVYEVTLNASNGPCSKAIGQTVVIQPNGIREASLPEGVSVFPNPVSTTLYLQCERQDWYPVQWRLFSSEGRLLQQGMATKDRQWDLDDLPGGLYLLGLSNMEGTWVVKVIKP